MDRAAQIDDAEDDDAELAHHDEDLPRHHAAAARRRVPSKKKAERPHRARIVRRDLISVLPDQDLRDERDPQRVEGEEDDPTNEEEEMFRSVALLCVVVDDVAAAINRFAAPQHAHGALNERWVHRKEDKDGNGREAKSGRESFLTLRCFVRAPLCLLRGSERDARPA